ncbi:MAG TPA: phosphate ABC transporter permease PstA [Candidatus Merdenecus merdavium]|nr:phosphate ABC transporter permease PstA [Candidatus Merdenecus merdavium]
MNRKLKDNILKGCVYASAGFTLLILFVIIGFIFVKGAPNLSIDFLTRNYENTTTYAFITKDQNVKEGSESGYISTLGITVTLDPEGYLVIKDIDKTSPTNKAVDGNQNAFTIKKGDQITKVGKDDIGKMIEGGASLSDVIHTINYQEDETMKVKVVKPGGGILPMVVTTIYMILLSIAIAAPIGVCASIYLNEYAKKGRLTSTIHFAIESLAGIPSIIYGLFGSVCFVKTLKLQYSILAGALTVSIMLLPIIISTTEETLKAIPQGYRESSLGLGATKLQTISKVVLPNAIPGILVALLLSIGRVVGESAALLLTAGTVAQIPKALFGNGASGATLTIKAYTLMKEENDLGTACAIGIVLLVIIICLNILSKWVANKFIKKRGI